MAHDVSFPFLQTKLHEERMKFDAKTSACRVPGVGVDTSRLAEASSRDGAADS